MIYESCSGLMTSCQAISRILSNLWDCVYYFGNPTTGYVYFIATIAVSAIINIFNQFYHGVVKNVHTDPRDSRFHVLFVEK